MAYSIKQDHFKKYLRMKNPLSTTFMILLGIIIPAILYLVLEQNFGLYALGAVTGLIVIYLSILYPKIWITLFVLSLPVYLYSRGDEVSAVDVGTGVYYNLGLVMWFVMQFFVFRRKIIRHIGDWLFIFFMTAMFMNLFVALSNGVDFLSWMREYSLYFLTLYYFPVREIFKEKKDLKYLLLVLVVSVLGASFYQFYYYYYVISSDEILYAYQLSRNVRLNQILFTSASLYGLVFAFGQDKKSSEWLLIIFTIISFIGMFVSFSRTYWVFYLFSVFIMFFYLSGKKKLSLLKYTGFVTVVMFFAIMTFWADNAQMYFKIINKRLTSSTKGTKDVSFIARQIEYAAAFEKIKEYPLGGNGLAKSFKYYNPIEEVSNETRNIHNGYIFFAYRLGIPLTLAYVFIILFYTYKAFYLMSRVKHDKFLKNLILGSFISLLLVWAANLTSAQFAYREGIITIAFTLAFVDIAELNIRKKQHDKK